MIAFIGQRVVQALFVLLGVSIIVFILTRISGDPALLYLGPLATEAELESLRRKLGLHDPVPMQYLRLLADMVRGDFGTSIRFREPALPLVLSRLPATAELGGASLIVALVVALPAGIIAAYNPGKIWDRLAMGIALFGYSVPTFWLGLILILVVSVQFRLLPASGRTGLDSIVLPAITLGFFWIAIIARLLRRSLVGVLRTDYIRTARAKGLREAVVLIRHALKNAAIPVVTVFGLQLGVLIGGAVITETVFAYPGMGLLVVNAILGRDFPIVQAFVAVTAVSVVTLNLIVDLVYFYLDPRISQR